MEYEIDDDPQGLPETIDGDRDGGLREDRLLFFADAPAIKRANRHDNAEEEDCPLQQLGEAA